MSIPFPPDISLPRFPLASKTQPAPFQFARFDRRSNTAPRPAEPTHRWLVDVTALARCRAIFSGHATEPDLAAADRRPSHQSLLEVPAAFDKFCRTHFAAVRRMHPEISWEDACPVYAIALSAHAALFVAIDAEREQLLAQHWDRVRGQSSLEWALARPLIADACSALHRMDPLAMSR